jgi:hypothetical protein
MEPTPCQSAVTDPFALNVNELAMLLVPGALNLPELSAVLSDTGFLPALRQGPQAQAVLTATQPAMASLVNMPATSYTAYRQFGRTGDRAPYQTPYFQRREALTAVALRVLLGQPELLDQAQDYIWAICEETNWVLPAHETVEIDLMAAETGYLLAETLAILGDALAGEVRTRVLAEVERRIFTPYLARARVLWWLRAPNNWNGVCNSAIAATFLWLEPERERVARALALALGGLRDYLAGGFGPDGGCDEGVGYWQYGLINFVALAEMLRNRTAGKVDLLSGARLRQIVSFPAVLRLSGAQFAPFADCDETVAIAPGIAQRLAERTGETSLLALRTAPSLSGENWRLPVALRSLLWWDSGLGNPEPAGDAFLPETGVARCVSRWGDAPIALAIKAGHNNENHNHNDVGSFVLHVAGESLLTDPGRGRYSRQYFGPERYDNIFVNSYGHSVPRIGRLPQQAGREHEGKFIHFEADALTKRVEIEFGRAYPQAAVLSARRIVTLDASGASLDDAFRFDVTPLEVEEAFITWAAVTLDGAFALVRGARHAVRLAIESPAGATWSVEQLEQASRANGRAGVLKRLTFIVPALRESRAIVRISLAPALSRGPQVQKGAP